MLWIGIHAPQLSLDALQTSLPPAQAHEPLALVAAGRVVAGNPAARQAGVQAGMKRATALALVPGLQMGAADAHRDQQALLSLAHALLAYTPSVSVVPPQDVLAEVQPSLRCFGGAEALWARMRDSLQPLGCQVQCAHAPGPLAALWLARHAPGEQPPRRWTSAVLAPPGQPSPDPVWAALHEQLAALPAELAVDDPGRAQALQAMGLLTLGDLGRQPRAGLGRRFGPALLDRLDRAWGRQPDPREFLRPPACFHSRIELPGRTEDTERLLAGAGALLQQLAAWAAAHQARVPGFTLGLHHQSRLRDREHGAAGAHVSHLPLAWADPGNDPAHWQAVLRERLAREPLAAPVLGLSLRCDRLEAGPAPQDGLFPELANGREGLQRLLERLEARLGPQGVCRLQAVADHRPEHATLCVPATRPAVAGGVVLPGPALRLTRPVWLLPEPQPLPERQSAPWYQGHPLHLLGGPERIETGWWDGATVLRDYFIAQAPGGELLWVYRLRPAPAAGQPGWFLHGRFG